MIRTKPKELRDIQVIDIMALGEVSGARGDPFIFPLWLEPNHKWIFKVYAGAPNTRTRKLETKTTTSIEIWKKAYLIANKHGKIKPIDKVKQRKLDPPGRRF